MMGEIERQVNEISVPLEKKSGKKSNVTDRNDPIQGDDSRDTE